MTARAPGDWDLTDYFSAPGADDYLAFRDTVYADLAGLVRRLADAAPISAVTLDPWAALLLELEDVSARARHLRSYLGCLAAADTTDEWVSQERADLTRHGSDLQKAESSTGDALAATADGDFDALVGREDLAHARYALRRMRQRAAWSMSAARESLAADLEVTALAAWSQLYDTLTGRMSFEYETPAGDTVEAPIAQVRSLTEDVDPAVRAAVAAGAARAWSAEAEVFAACLNAISGTRLALYEHRGVDDFLEPALFDGAIERATLDAMWAVVRERQEVPRQYLRMKAKRLGVERLAWSDLRAPLPLAGEARLSWDAAKALLVDAFSSRYPALGEFAQMAFERRWIDHTPRAGKRQGAFCSSSHVNRQSRVFMSFGGALGDVFTLAHELGHAWHNWVLRDTPSFARRYPMTLAETASTFAEQLLVDHVLEDPAASPVARAQALDRQLQAAATFLLNIPTRFDFERAVYTARAAGELSVRRLKTMMLDAQRANYGDALAADGLNPWFWASKLHFYIARVSFYNFPYTFGHLFSTGIAARARAEGPGFLPRYEALLKMTGVATAEEVAAEMLGADLSEPAFWHRSIDLLESALARYEGTCAEAFAAAP